MKFVAPMQSPSLPPYCWVHRWIAKPKHAGTPHAFVQGKKRAWPLRFPTLDSLKKNLYGSLMKAGFTKALALQITASTTIPFPMGTGK